MGIIPGLGDILRFIYNQKIFTIPESAASFKDKIVIITGANTGLGKEAVKYCVKLGASKVILACRNISKGIDAKHAIESSLKCSPDIIEVWEVDLASYDSVRKFAAKANQLPRLDALIENAAVATYEFQVAEGTELQMTVNVISTFLLALLLLPKLRETGKVHGIMPHLTFVVSGLYALAKYPEKHGKDVFGWVSEKKNAIMNTQYHLTKLFEVFVARELASIISPIGGDKFSDPNPFVINYVDPGLCHTELARDLGLGLKIFKFLFARTAEEGSRTLVIAASAGRETHGQYMTSGAVEKLQPHVTSAEGLERGKVVWEQLKIKLDKIQPGILANIQMVL